MASKHFKIKPLYRKIAFYVILGVLLLPCYKFSYTFAKYVFDRTYDNYLLSKDFYFESNILSRVGNEYSTDDWDASSVYDISFQLNNFIDDLRWTSENVPYNISVDCDPSVAGNVSCTTSNGTINYSSLNGTTNIVHILLSNPNNLEFDNDDYVDMSITATSTSPYRKSITASIRIGVNYNGITYVIKDNADQKYFDLMLANSTSDTMEADLSWNPSLVSVDNSNYTYPNNGVTPIITVTSQ